MITQTTPSITDATEYKEAHGSIPGGSIIRTADNRLMVVERSNGYVISGMEQGKTGINANMVIDLRNTSATIVTVTTFVDDTPAPVEVKPAPEAPTVIVWRELQRYGGKQWSWPMTGDFADAQREAHARLTAAFAPAPSDDLPEVKPESTIPPALLDTAERVIRLPLLPTTPLLPSGNNAVALLPAYCPIALPSEVVEIGGTEYRITSHGTIISIEKRDSKGNWQHEANYGNAEQVKRFLERMERESNSPGAIPFVYDDGGREAAGYKGQAGDCVTRAIAIASNKPYQEVYDALNALAKDEKPSKRRKGTSSARTGVHKTTYEKYLRALGFEWTPTMQIGQGCTVHLRASELPSHGRYIVSCSKHTVALIEGVVHDTYDPSRDGTRCVYGYWKAPQPAPVVKPEAPRPADVRVSYKCHDIAAVYGVAGADTWTVYSDGPIVRKGVYTRFHSAESAIAAAKATIDIKAAAGIRKGLRGL